MTQPAAIGKTFKKAIGHMAHQAWLVGHLDAASTLIEAVLKEAEENASAHPRDKETKEAVKRLARAHEEISQVSARLSQIALGEVKRG